MELFEKADGHLDRWGEFTIHARGEHYDQIIKTHYIEIADDRFGTLAVYTVMNGWDVRMFIPAHDIISVTDNSAELV